MQSVKAWFACDCDFYCVCVVIVIADDVVVVVVVAVISVARDYAYVLLNFQFDSKIQSEKTEMNALTMEWNLIHKTTRMFL